MEKMMEKIYTLSVKETLTFKEYLIEYALLFVLYAPLSAFMTIAIGGFSFVEFLITHAILMIGVMWLANNEK